MRGENEYDLVILDVMLPVKDGYAVCQELRAAGFRHPVLMLTARDAVDDRVRGLDSGADDYLDQAFRLQGTAGPDPRAVAAPARDHGPRSCAFPTSS